MEHQPPFTQPQATASYFACGRVTNRVSFPGLRGFLECRSFPCKTNSPRQTEGLVTLVLRKYHSPALIYRRQLVWVCFGPASRTFFSYLSGHGNILSCCLSLKQIQDLELLWSPCCDMWEISKWSQITGNSQNMETEKLNTSDIFEYTNASVLRRKLSQLYSSTSLLPYKSICLKGNIQIH